MTKKQLKGLGRLTNEDISKKFDNQFELVLYAIRLAENMIRSGREPRIKADIQNKAMLILEEILNGKDTFQEIDLDGVSSVSNKKKHHVEAE